MTISNDLAGVVGQRGYRSGLDWAPQALAARITDRLAARSPGGIGRNPHHRHRWARDALGCPQILAAVRSMIGPQVVVVEPAFLITKQPGGFVVPPHQDGLNDRMVLDPLRAVAVWFAVTDATAANGCIQVVPGSHLDGYLPHVWGVDEGNGRPYTLSDPPADDRFVAVPMAAGQACVMDVRLIHRSGVNRTAAARIGLNVCYTAPGALTVQHGAAPALYRLVGGADSQVSMSIDRRETPT